MTEREALQIAFNALAAIDRETPYPIAKHAIKCINAVFNTQAQPEQEPALKVHRGEICYKSQDDDQSFGMWCPVDYNIEHGYPNETKFYTAPPSKPWVSLTDEELETVVDTIPYGMDCIIYWDDLQTLIRNIEAALKEKNT